MGTRQTRPGVSIHDDGRIRLAFIEWKPYLWSHGQGSLSRKNSSNNSVAPGEASTHLRMLSGNVEKVSLLSNTAFGLFSWLN